VQDQLITKCGGAKAIRAVINDVFPCKAYPK